MIRTTASALILIASLSACGDDDAGIDASTTDARVEDAAMLDGAVDDAVRMDAPLTGMVTLSVVSESTERLSDGLYSVIIVNLENGTNRSLPMTYLEFRISDDEGNTQVGSDIDFDGRCPARTIAPGASRECGIAFDAVTGSVFIATEIHYAGPEGLRASATVPTECERCGGDACVDLMTDADNCGTCFFNIGDASACEAGAPVCEAGSIFEGGACTACSGPLCFPPHRLTEDNGSYIVVGLPPIACDDVCALVELSCVIGEHSGMPTPSAHYEADLFTSPACSEAPPVGIGGLRLVQAVCTCE